MTISGLLYVKHQNVGTRSEGPAYFLQTAKGDLVLTMNDRPPWQPDYELEFYGRAMVEVEGDLEGAQLKVHGIHRITSSMIPALKVA